MADGKKIVAFCCENSGFKAAEPIRSSAAMKSVEIVKVPCSGKVEVRDMLKAVEQGADHVLVLACPFDNCKYIRGNKRALKRVAMARSALNDAGLEDNRISIEFLSSVDTHKLMEILKKLETKKEELATDKH
jgi:F420-non-reducing hydrogenase iron-sulfur subunit